MFTSIKSILSIEDINKHLDNDNKAFKEDIVKLYNTIVSWLDHCKSLNIKSDKSIEYEKYRDLNFLIKYVNNKIVLFKESLNVSNKIFKYLNIYNDNYTTTDNNNQNNSLLNFVINSKEHNEHEDTKYDGYEYSIIKTQNVKYTKNNMYHTLYRDCDCVSSICASKIKDSYFKSITLYNVDTLYTAIASHDCYCYWPIYISYDNTMKFYDSTGNESCLYLLNIQYSINVQYCINSKFDCVKTNCASLVINNILLDNTFRSLMRYHMNDFFALYI